MNANLRRGLVLMALCAGGLAAHVGTPQPPLAADEVSAGQLAEWIRARRPGIRVLDTRDAEAMERDRLPTARAANDVDADAIASGDTVVVYAERRIDEAAVETLRQRLHWRGVLRLHGGVEAWNAEVLFPVLRSDASARQQQDFVARAQLSRYFGGTPRVLDPGAAREHPRSRRGC
ncbi:MAG: rhodanese-like domain-containing protein [Tahibacter sp.]